MQARRSWWFSAVLGVILVLAFSTEAQSEEAGEQPEKVVVGQQAPAFSLESLDGVSLRLEDLRGKSPLVLIFFRGTW